MLRFLFVLIFLQSLFVHASEKNRLIVCENGLEMFQWDLDFLQEATQSVEILACFFGGQVAQRILEEVEKAFERSPSIQVYILASPILVTQQNYAKIHSLQCAYPGNFHIQFSTQVARLLPDIIAVDNHVKMFIVDETYFSTGGTNLEDRHCSQGTFTPSGPKRNETHADAVLPAGMRDQDVVGKGPLAKPLRKIFYELYAIWENYNVTHILKDNPESFARSTHYFPVTHTPFVERFETSERLQEVESVKILLGGPHQKINPITEEYLRLIRSAQEEIVLEHLYFLPIEPLRNALVAAANRGVKITLITNGISETSALGASFFVWGNRISYVPILYGQKFYCWDAWSMTSRPVKNTRIYEYNVPDVFLHKKLMIIDGKISVVGSYNFGLKSAYADYEIVLVLESEEVSQDLLSNHQTDLQFSREISPEEACRWYFDPVISYIGELQRKFGGLL